MAEQHREHPVRRRAGQVGRELPDLVVRQRFQSQQRGRAGRQVRGERFERGRAGERAARSDEQQRQSPGLAREVLPHLQRRLVRPLQIVDHERERPVRAQLPHQSENALNRVQLRVLGERHRQFRAAQVRGPRVHAERVQQRTQGKALVERVRGGEQCGVTGFVCQRDGFGQQRGPADSRFALDPHRTAEAAAETGDGFAEQLQLVFPPDERRRTRRQDRQREAGNLRDGHGRHRRIGGQQLFVQLPQRRTRLGARRFDQPLAQFGVDGQRLVMPARLVECSHEQSVQRLAERVFRGELAELRDEPGGLARVHRQLGPAFDGRQPQLLQPHPLRGGVMPGETLQRRAVPLRESLVEHAPRLGPASLGEQAVAEVAQRTEAVDVDLLRFDAERVAGPGGRDQPRFGALAAARFENAAQSGDIGVDAPLRTGRGRVAPHCVDEHFTGDGAVRREGEHREDCAPMSRTEVELPVAEPGSHRSEQLDFRRRDAAGCRHRSPFTR